MSFFGDFVGGAATAGADILGDKIKAEREQELVIARAKVLSDLQEGSAVRAEQRGMANRATERQATAGEVAASQDAARAKMLDAIKNESSAIVDGNLAGHQVVDASTWTPEMEAARNQGIVAMAKNPRIRAQAASNVGYSDEAAKLDKIAESGASTVAWGSTRVDGDGNVIYDNGSALKGSINQEKADGKVGAKRADHFDEKQWDAAAKIDKSVVSLPNAMGDKDVESVDLRSAYLRLFNSAKSSGDMSPNEAVEFATTKMAQIKSLAQARVAKAAESDKGSKLTVEQAVRDIVKEGNQYKPAPSSTTQATGGNSTEAGMKVSAQSDMGADPKAIQREIARTTADLKVVTDPESREQLQEHLSNMTRQLANIGGTPNAPAPVKKQGVIGSVANGGFYGAAATAERNAKAAAQQGADKIKNDADASAAALAEQAYQAKLIAMRKQLGTRDSGQSLLNTRFQ